MEKNWLRKSWLSPLTGMTFLLVGGTGVLMLFELHHSLPGMKMMHEWLGVLFVLAGLLHFCMHLRRWLGYFRDHRFASFFAVVLVFLAAAGLLAMGIVHGPPESGPGHPYRGGETVTLKENNLPRER